MYGARPAPEARRRLRVGRTRVRHGQRRRETVSQRHKRMWRRNQTAKDEVSGSEGKPEAIDAKGRSARLVASLLPVGGTRGCAGGGGWIMEEDDDDGFIVSQKKSAAPFANLMAEMPSRIVQDIRLGRRQNTTTKGGEGTGPGTCRDGGSGRCRPYRSGAFCDAALSLDGYSDVTLVAHCGQ